MGKVTFFVVALLLLGNIGAFSRQTNQPATPNSSNHTTSMVIQMHAGAQPESKQPDTGVYFDMMGWLGTFFYILAYLLLTLRKIKSHQKIYHLMNVFGALGLIANALHLRDMPSLVVNIVWLGIGLLAIGWMVMKKKEPVS